MAKEPAEAKLKLIHLVWTLVVAVAAAGVTFGAMLNQQATNTESIKDKVPNKMFENHQVEQRIAFKRMEGKLDTIIGKL